MRSFQAIQYSAATLLLWLVCIFPACAQADRFCDHVHDVLNRMMQLHYSPMTVDAEVKKEMMQIYLEDADPKNRFFSLEDAGQLKNMATTDGLCKAYLHSKDLYKKRVGQYDSLVKLILQKPLDFTAREQLIVPGISQRAFFAEKDRRTQLTQKLKYKLLDLAYEKFIDDSTTDLKTLKKLSPALEKELRSKLQTREEIFVKRLRADDAHQRLSGIFLNALAKRYDPHSSYFSEQTKKEFEENLSKDNRTFGISLHENENFEIVVAEVLPGSPAWISNQVHEEEVLESVTDKKGVTHELQYTGMEHVSGILRNPDNAELTFNLRNQSNEKTSVTLVKAKVENAENSFRGYLFSDEQLKIGYVPLPSFYTDFESDQGLGCANDVAKEILLLKKENIQGLILDLRDNGGGSLKEALEIAGLFIDEGPLGAMKMKGTKPFLMKDFNRGTVYDGPLIIMVNGLSASASEFLSGCLQDYGRAVIVGDDTYGKGTAQSVYPVDTIAYATLMQMGDPSAPDAFPYQNTFLKVTEGKFYHVSQRSNQSNGVHPDIRIPDVYSSLEFFKEKNEPYHLPNDSVAKKMFYKKMETGLSPAARERCQLVISNDKNLQQIARISDSLNIFLTKEKNIPLEFTAFLEHMQKQDAFYERMDKTYDRRAEVYKVSNHTFADQLLKLDASEKDFNERVMEELYYDPALEQAFLIFREIINKK